MKLYLSSYHLGNTPKKLINLTENNKNAAILINALDFSTDLERKKESIKKETTELKNLGFKPEVLDLRKYFLKPFSLQKKLSNYGFIWVMGGNVFILRKAMKLSGFDKWLIKSKNNNNLIYGGYSAGVCVLSPSLKGIELVDNPNLVVPGYPKKIIWRGIGLINWSFAPHYKSNHPESQKINKVIEFYKKNNLPFKALRDGEIIITTT